MNTASKLIIGAIAGIGLTVAAVAYAHHHAFAHGPGGFGPGMMRGMGPGMQQPMMARMGHGMAGRFGGPMAMAQAGQHDAAFAADMNLVHEMIGNHDRITRKVTRLPNGIKTVTESDDPRTAQAIKAHVASMEQRLKDGREFNLFSRTLPVLFANRDKIRTQVQTTDKGVIVTQTSSDPTVVAALQAHAAEVTELAQEGMLAMMRSARASMGMMSHGPVPPAATTSR